MRAESSPWTKAARSWAWFDFVYSLFFYLMLTVALTPWVIDDHHKPDMYISITQVLVALADIIAMPALGAVADRTGRRKPFFAVGIIATVIFTALIGFVHVSHSVFLVLLLAWLATVFLQLGFAQYEPMLATVARPAARGRVSGVATGLGFLGVISAVILDDVFFNSGSRQHIFLPDALILLVGSVPFWLWVHDRPTASQRAVPRAEILSIAIRGVRRSFVQLAESIQKLRRHPDAGRLLISKFLYTDAIGAVNTFMLVYMQRLHVPHGRQPLALGVGVISAAVAAFVIGKVVERVGPRRLLVWVLPTFATGIAASAAIGQPWTIWLIAPAVGGSLGTVWTSDRVFMLRLTPAELRGEFFGFFNLVNRAGSSFGPLVLWSGTILILHTVTGALDSLSASRVALGLLAISGMGGWLLVRNLADHERYDDDELPAAAPAPVR